MTSPDKIKTPIKTGIETRNRIRYGAAIYRVTQEQFAEMVVIHFFGENKDEVNELAESMMYHPEDHSDILARINGQAVNT